MEEYNLTLGTSGYVKEYRRFVNPTISNVFAAAAFR